MEENYIWTDHIKFNDQLKEMFSSKILLIQMEWDYCLKHVLILVRNTAK